MFSTFLQAVKSDWNKTDKTLLKAIVIGGTLILTYIWLNAELWIIAYTLGAIHLVACALLFTSVLLNLVSVFQALIFASGIATLAMLLSWGWVYGIDLTLHATLAAKTSGSAFGSIIFGLVLRLWLAIKSV